MMPWTRRAKKQRAQQAFDRAMLAKHTIEVIAFDRMADGRHPDLAPLITAYATANKRVRAACEAWK